MSKKKTIFNKKSDAGKGDVPRIGISQKEWDERWEKIFNKNNTSGSNNVGESCSASAELEKNNFGRREE